MRNGKDQGRNEQTGILVQAILDLSKIVMYEFHHDYMKRKYDDDKLTLCYMDTDSLIYSIETDDFYKDIDDGVTDRFDMSSYNPNRPLPVGLNKKVIGLMKDELGGEIMTEFVTLRPKMYAYKTGSAKSMNLRNSAEKNVMLQLYLTISSRQWNIHPVKGSMKQIGKEQ